MKQGDCRILVPLAASLFMFGLGACSNEKESADAPAPESEIPVAEQPPDPARAKICEKLKAAVVETLGVEVTGVKANAYPGLPLQCSYNPDDATGPWFEIMDGADLVAARRHWERNGSGTKDAPDLGPGGFTTTNASTFAHIVIGAKNGKEITVRGHNVDFEKLRAFWKKVAETV